MRPQVAMHQGPIPSTSPRLLKIVALTTVVIVLGALLGVAVIGAAGPQLTFVEVQRD